VVDSAMTTAAAVQAQLQVPTRAGNPGAPARGSVTWLATDGAARFARVGSIFLGETLPVDTIEVIDL